MPHYQQTFVPFSGTSFSATTSTPICVADFKQLSLSIESSTGSASRYTVWGTAVSGWNTTFRATDFSVATAIVTQGVYTIDPGLAWMYFQRDSISVSASSNATFTLSGVVGG